MTKIRLTLLFLALGVGIPAGALVLRAVESLELENAYRHEAVAERVFDEMERSLSDFLLREEPRPPSDYDLGLVREGAEQAVSPLFRGANEPFIVGWFSLDSAGETRWLAPQPADSLRITRAVEAALGSRNAPREAGPAASASLALTDNEGPAPGRTKSTGRSRLEKKVLGRSDGGTLGESSAYDVLQNLNRAQSLRSERHSKTLRQAESEFGASAPAMASARALKDEARRRLDDSDVESIEESLQARGDVAEDRPFESTDPVADRATHGILAEREVETSANVDPLIGRVTETGDIVLTRSVWRGGGVERQGLVLDRAKLASWLRDRVLSETGLADRARVDFAVPDLASRADVEHRYLHRFAEPFDALVARLELEPLTGVGSTRPIYTLALLLVLVGVTGFFAVDRMTRVVVEYAQRRNNFVAAVSHELKTPLTSIRMYGEMLRDGLVASEDKRIEYYETITGESERLSRLIDNVLEFSRLEQDRRDLDFVVEGLTRTIRDTAEKLRTHVEREGFVLKVDVDETSARIRYDRDAITQILFNLVDNAIKYARNAERREISIRLVDRDGHVELSVRDFGPGVPRDQRERIFEPFYRVGDELTRTTEGTGIGLALVKELVKKSGGRIRASRPEGGGFEVTIEFDPDEGDAS